jgi:hypothetical protein
MKYAPDVGGPISKLKGIICFKKALHTGGPSSNPKHKRFFKNLFWGDESSNKLGWAGARNAPLLRVKKPKKMCVQSARARQKPH